MAFQSHRTRFQGDLAGVKQEEIIKLDYDLENKKERLEYLDSKYDSIKKYHEEYTSEYYKVDVNKDDNLSADINIFKSIERDGSYLINSLDIPRDEQYKYNMLTQEEFDRKIREEQKADIFEEGVIDVLKPNFKNDFKNMDLKITNADLTEDSEMGRVLRDYDKVKCHIKDEMSKIRIKEKSYLSLGKAKMILGTINCDMLDSKKSYKGITRPSTKLGDIGSAPDYDAIDYSNPAHIKAIIITIRFGELQPDSQLSHIAYDIQNAIEKLHKNNKLDELDLEIIDCLNSGYSERRTAEELGKGKTTIQQRVAKICKRISKFYSN